MPLVRADADSDEPGPRRGRGRTVPCVGRRADGVARTAKATPLWGERKRTTWSHDTRRPEGVKRDGWQRLPFLWTAGTGNRSAPSLSGVIPARKEARTIGRVRSSLTSPPEEGVEIIGVDDESEGRTADIAERHVPAYAIFGVFFIVLTLLLLSAGSIRVRILPSARFFCPQWPTGGCQQSQLTDSGYKSTGYRRKEKPWLLSHYMLEFGRACQPHFDGFATRAQPGPGHSGDPGRPPMASG